MGVLVGLVIGAAAVAAVAYGNWERQRYHPLDAIAEFCRNNPDSERCEPIGVARWYIEQLCRDNPGTCPS